MAQSSREVVRRCVKFEFPERIPRDLWLLPWAENHYPALVEEIKKRFPSDFCYAPDVYQPSPRAKGDPYAIGEYTDEWGCVFTNVHGGVIGEVKEFLVKNISDSKTVEPPYEILPEKDSSAKEKVNKFCAGTEKFAVR